jgi:hypothetical protein
MNDVSLAQQNNTVLDEQVTQYMRWLAHELGTRPPT